MRLSPAELTALVDAKETSPHRFLGLHPLQGGGLVARALLPWASACELLPEGGKPLPMTCLHASGVFEVEIGCKIHGLHPDEEGRVSHRSSVASNRCLHRPVRTLLRRGRGWC